MGAQSSSQRDGKEEDASVSASASGGQLSAEVKVLQEDSKPLEKNGQISSLTSLNGHSEDKTLAEVGQPDGVSVAQKEEAPDTTETTPVEGTPQLNGEKMEKEAPEANDITSAEEKPTDEKPENTSEVGFKKIFTIVGLKFTLKKDKSTEADPVKLLTVKDKEGEEVTETEGAVKDEEAEEKTPAEGAEADKETPTTEVEETKDAAEAQPEGAASEAANEEVKVEEAEPSSPPKETGVSSFRKFFLVGLFSNLRKKTSIKKMKEEEENEEETAQTEEPAAEEKEEKDAPEQETKMESDDVPEQEAEKENAVTEEKTEEDSAVTEQETKTDIEMEKSESEPKEEAKSDATPEEKVEASETAAEQPKQEDQAVAEEKVPAEVTSEAELLSSQEKSKPHGSPLKKLFTGAGLKKLSTKRQKNKKESESKPAESGEQTAEKPQSSSDHEETPKAESGPSSPEASGEHVIAVEVNQHESSQEAEGEVASDGERKKDGVIASFRKLVTPKKHPKRSSDSEDEGTGDKPVKSATLSSSESAPLAEKTSEEEETKEDKTSEEEPKTENTDKLTSSTEETKKKMDTSVSWDTLMCMGGSKKRTRRTSDSDDDDETKAEEVNPGATASAEEKHEAETEDAAVPQNPENEEVTPEPEPVTAPPVRESPWSTLKRLVMSKNKSKSEEKPEEPAEQVQSDSETHKDESSFSLRKLFHGRRKKVAEKQASIDQGSGEEDSDTPAVVPLSEYEEKTEAGQEAPAEPAVVQTKVSADDRSPSWIPAIVEDTDDKHDQLSDIPEEAENAATPKSVDSVAEDETDDKVSLPVGPGSTGRRLSTAEVKPITPAPAAATSPVPHGPKRETAEEIICGIEAQVPEIPAQTSVSLEDVPMDEASATTEQEPETENAKSLTIAILEPHAKTEATAICTGLESEEIASVAVEQPVEPTVECSGPLTDTTGVEIAVQEKPVALEEAEATEDLVLKAHVHQVQTLELESGAEKLESEAVGVQVASESYEPEIEKVGAVTTENSEVVQPTAVGQNSPKTDINDPIIPTPETAVCSQTVQVSEVTIETKEVNMEVEQQAANKENVPVEEVKAVELSSAVCKEDTEGTETAAPAVVPNEEEAVVSETVVLVAPPETEPVQDQETKQEGAAEDLETATEKIQDVNEEVHEASEIVTQSVVIAEAVIKEAVDKVLEDVSQPQKSASPTKTIPTPVKATATTESEADIVTDQLIITDTPVPVTCEKPVIKSPQPLCVAMEITETVPLEVTQDIKEEENEEEEPERSLKKAKEVEVSEEAMIEEEVTEIKEGVEEIKESEKETGDDAKLQENKEVKTENVREIHMPTQVVLQSAEVVDEQPVEVEIVTELNGDGPNVTSENPAKQNNLPDLMEEPQESASEEAAASSQTAGAEEETETKPSGKCAEVMAQVMEVIEEAVKEIEPVSTEITAAS